MLARRIIAVSPDKVFGKQLATALKAAGGAVDLHQTLDELGKGELQAALVVLHLDAELSGIASEILPRLTGESRVVAILPKANLSGFVDVMQSSDRVAAMLVAEGLDVREVSAVATRILAGDIFGLEKLLHWGTQVHSQLVGDYQEKSGCISQISEFAELMGVRRKYRESIEQCIDEMLMNALYDAPVDDQGQHIFSEIPTKTRISLRVEQKVVVQYACDGKQFVISVRDAFGTLERNTVLKYLHKCLHAEQQIDRKVGGAGLGLYLMVNSASTLLFNVLPGVATEAVCVFDLETPKLQLEQLGFFTEKIDAAGRLATGPSKRLPGTSHPVERRREEAPAPQMPRGLVPALGIAIAAMFVLISIAAWPRLFGGKKTTHVTFTTVPHGATIEIEGQNVGTASTGSVDVPDLEVGRAYSVVARLDGYEPKQAVVQPHTGGNEVTLPLKALGAMVELDSQPSGASVEVDGKVLGTTPMNVTTLPVGTTVALTFKKTGYQDTVGKLDVPTSGKEIRLVQPLAVALEFAQVKLRSEPSGAQVFLNGQRLVGVVTPAEILVEAGKVQRFVMTMPHKVPAVLDPFVPDRGASLVRTAKLSDGVAIKLDATIDGRITVANAPHCKDLQTPAECVLAAGTYNVDFTGVFNGRATRPLVVTDHDRTEHFEFGFVDAAPGKSIVVSSGVTAKHVAFEAGLRSVNVADEAGTHPFMAKVKTGTTVVAN